VTYCRRTGPGLSAIVRSGGGDIAQDPATMAALVDDAWSALP
jgi:hypothetical protein